MIKYLVFIAAVVIAVSALTIGEGAESAINAGIEARLNQY